MAFLCVGLVVIVIVQVCGGSFTDKVVDGGGQVGWGLVPVDADGRGVSADKDLYRGMYSVLRVPIDVEPSDKRQKSRAGEGVIPTGWRPFGVGGLASWQLGFLTPPM